MANRKHIKSSDLTTYIYITRYVYLVKNKIGALIVFVWQLFVPARIYYNGTLKPHSVSAYIVVLFGRQLISVSTRWMVYINASI